MPYIKRIMDTELQKKLSSSGAVLIRGAKACGKTESAKQISASILNVDKDEQVSAIMGTAPERLLLGKTPRLIDEWQEQPKLWDYIRREIDERKTKAQFILTGSANPPENVKLHSGAGRFTTLDMRTMSWQELGFSSGKISLEKLFKGEKITITDEPVKLEFIVEKIIIGGFPALIGEDINGAMEL
ncbi:MAG: AAA family ATPase, partial [Elusimicrobiota bacterium]|nr:AAA family ATPase [Elusimicrobiota bacterium]